MTMTYNKARELTESWFSLIPYSALEVLQLSDFTTYRYSEEDEVLFGYGYYSDDSLMQSWIEENIDFLVNKLNFIVEYYETLGYVLCMPSVGHDYIEDYFVDFWEAYFLNDTEIIEKKRCFINGLVELDVPSVDVGALLDNIDAYISKIEVKDFDFENEIIYLDEGIESLFPVLKKPLEVLRVEVGYRLDNDWLVLEKKY